MTSQTGPRWSRPLTRDTYPFLAGSLFFRRCLLFCLFSGFCLQANAATAGSISVGLFSLFHPAHIEAEVGQPLMLELSNKTGVIQRVLLPGQKLRVQVWDDHLKASFFEQDGRLQADAEGIALRGPEGSYTLSVPQRIRRSFFGSLRINSVLKELRLQLIVPEETATEQILRSEMAACRQVETLKAQAILVRSFLRSSQTKHRREGFDYCDTTHCQFFTGFVEENDLFHEAVISTRGWILTFLGESFPPMYTAACGGQTLERGPSTLNSTRPDRGYPYRSVACSYCASHPLYRWESRLSRTALIQIFSTIHNASGVANRMSELAQPDPTDPSSQELRRQIRLRVGRRLGWNIIRSDRYRIEATADPVRIEGWGSGHNTGFCQAGATELGQQGKTAAQILGFYFPGSEIRRIDLFR